LDLGWYLPPKRWKGVNVSLVNAVKLLINLQKTGVAEIKDESLGEKI
jgi:hypothetical protein